MDDSQSRKLARVFHEGRPQDILAKLDTEQRLIIRDVVEYIVEDAAKIDIMDVWERDQLASTYWILFMSGVDQEDEGLLAKELLLWSTLFAKHSARVACIQSSDRSLFKFCTAHFNVKAWPTLVFSDRPDMLDFLSIDGHLLTSLSERRGGVRRLLTELHALVESGGSISAIANTIASEKFWQRLKLVYSEAKSFISISIKSGGLEAKSQK